MGISEDISTHMHRVQEAQRDLRDLGMIWRTIESCAAISCPEEVAPILPTLISTRERFEALQDRLIEQMTEESCEALGDELSAKAQCAIDILVRNLFERTADVGFLATDDSVRDFCGRAADQRASGRAAMVARLAEYQAKYTVYDDIVLLGPDGEVLARLDAAQALTQSHDPLLAAALTARGHVERFGPSDLQADGRSALRYAHRIAASDGRTLGVLVLKFRFDDEMVRIFEGVADARLEMAIVLIGDDQRVVASNDEAHVPLGAKLVRMPGDGVQLTTFSGREYLAVCCSSPGYQGYAGPGWRAQAMVSLLTAFRRGNSATAPTDSGSVPLDHPALLVINRDADDINRDLRRVVWNGRLMAGGHHGDQLRLKAVLAQVNSASLCTRHRVNGAINDLARTSLHRAQSQSQDLARLAADIMDRNLYERANDCRWWALSPAIQQALADGEATTAPLNALLDHINGLYTVYSRLVVFDAGGRICAASRAGDLSGLIGSAIAPGWLDKVRRLQGSQQYAVSDFEDTPLHDGGPTYTYLAAIRDPAGQQMLGGIAIVFHAARELGSMLQEVLGDRKGFAVFLDAQGRQLASSDPGLSQGAPIQGRPDEFMFEHGGAHYLWARAPASGYREFKTADGYANGVTAAVALRLGAAERRRTTFADLELKVAAPPSGRDSIEVAVFQVGAMRYGLPTHLLMNAVSRQGLVQTPDQSGPTVGMLEVEAGGGSALIQVLCARRLFGVDYPSRVSDGVVLVLRDPARPQRPALGLRVDDVLTVLEFDAGQRHPAPTGMQAFAPWISGLIDCMAHGQGKPAPEALLIQLMDPTRLGAWPPGATVASD
ncbi:chemotaxis protein CheW, partial [Ideonella sp.]|uniref:chemotaxis protein CheW n=1 Tax=Ideonella sp. TaxID=1929293 RepID=UPI003BB69BCF